MRSLRGQGSYGVVYQVESVENGKAGPFALKLALYAGDPRFEREGELLSRLRHPNVPRLRARGGWEPRGGGLFPYLVMDWVEGIPLYEWATPYALTSRQVLWILAQVARALEATHAVGGVHRDVKGDNILIQPHGRAVLMDFGSGNYQGAPVLTRHLPPPGTPEYYSPESLRFQWEHRHHPLARYEAQPSDDVYALGVTAYRLVTGKYPEALDMELTAEGFRPIPPKWVPPQSDEVNLCPELAELIQRMLSQDPSSRGSAREMARALERAAKTARASADQPIHPRSAASPFVGAPPFTPAHRILSTRPALAVALGVCLGIGVWWAGRPSREGTPDPEFQEAQDGGVVGLADAGLETSEGQSLHAPMRWEIGRDMPKKPLAGQRRPPCGKRELEINGGCWIHDEGRTPPCGDELAEWKNGCYWPLLKFPLPATSDTP
ncbi:serine/threonine protein kinase [Stigmatella aurantiaca]|uniref:Protein kinase n=1 Tax=Stigmatella aurantiaca (strain DW4/3-1) TaxID=378806 RepID=E3FXK8_STIAD|nr:serine/threonine-protein kinase [Stigmatella aurantiaca]ADO74803.1 Protein kinase [Stigmatella aurantiaca DW4/3-1]